MSTTLSPKDLATIWGTDPKTVRRFLRNLTPDRAGKGGRWEIGSEDVEMLTTHFKNRASTQRFVAKEANADAEEIDDVVAETDEEFDELTDELDEVEEL